MFPEHWHWIQCSSKETDAIYGLKNATDYERKFVGKVVDGSKELL